MRGFSFRPGEETGRYNLSRARFERWLPGSERRGETRQVFRGVCVAVGCRGS